jgi:uncharacterized protein YcfJ
MRVALKVGMLALTLAVVPMAVQAGTLEGAAIGAGTGAVIAGPVGAVVGGAIGAMVGGPNIVHRHYRHADNYRTCWLDRRGYRHCEWR